MYAFICIILMLFGALVPQQKVDGFSGCAWGIAKTDSLTKVFGLVASSKNDGPMHRYTATLVNKFGKATDVTTYFYFYKDQLSAVVLRTTRMENAVSIFDEIEKVYGKGVRASSKYTVSTYSGMDLVEHYVWGFSNTFIEHDYDKDSYATFTILKSQRLDNMQFEDKANARKKEYEGK